MDPRQENNTQGFAEPETGGWLSSLARCCGTAADRRNQVSFLAWMFCWMLLYALAAKTLQGKLSIPGLPVEGRVGWWVAALPNILAAGVLFSYVKFLRMADELTRLIQVQSLAVGFGAWLFLTMAWELFEDAGAPPLSDDLALAIPLLAIGLGQLYLSRRYA